MVRKTGGMRGCVAAETPLKVLCVAHCPFWDIYPGERPSRRSSPRPPPLPRTNQSLSFGRISFRPHAIARSGRLSPSSSPTLWEVALFVGRNEQSYKRPKNRTQRTVFQGVPIHLCSGRVYGFPAFCASLSRPTSLLSKLSRNFQIECFGLRLDVGSAL